MSKQEDLHRPETPLEKTRKIDNSMRHPAKFSRFWFAYKILFASVVLTFLTNSVVFLTT